MIEIADSNLQFLFIFADSTPQNPRKHPKIPQIADHNPQFSPKIADSTPQICYLVRILLFLKGIIGKLRGKM